MPQFRVLVRTGAKVQLHPSILGNPRVHAPVNFQTWLVSSHFFHFSSVLHPSIEFSNKGPALQCEKEDDFCDGCTILLCVTGQVFSKGFEITPQITQQKIWWTKFYSNFRVSRGRRNIKFKNGMGNNPLNLQVEYHDENLFWEFVDEKFWSNNIEKNFFEINFT